MTCRSTAWVLCQLALMASLASGPRNTAAETAPRPPRPDTEPAAEAGEKGATSKDDGRQQAKPRKTKDRYFAVTGAIVHTISGPILNGPTILAKNGKVIAIGDDMKVPPEAEILNATGFHLYPGLVAVGSSGIVGNEPPEDNSDVFSLSITLALAGGITTAVTGNTAAKLTFGTLEDHVLKRDLFFTLRYSTQDPEGRRRFRQTLERARQYLRDLESHEEDKKADPAAKPPDKTWMRANTR